MVKDVWAASGKGIDARHEIHVSGSRSLAKAADTIRDPCWQCPDLTRYVRRGFPDMPEMAGVMEYLRCGQVSPCGR